MPLVSKRRLIDQIELNDHEKKNLQILDTIRKKGPIARAEISRLIGLNIVTVTSYIDQYIKKGVIKEVGIDVDNLQYFASQSWAFPHSLMIAYTARYAGGELRPDPTEIEDVRWFAVDKLPELPTTVSISRRLIDTTVARLRAQPE